MASGIGLAAWLPILIHPLLYFLAAVLSWRHLSHSSGRAPVIALLLGAGLMTWSLSTQRAAEEYRAPLLDDREDEELEGSIVGPTHEMPGREQVSLQTASERIWLTIYGDEAVPSKVLSPGTRIAVSARLKTPIGLRGLGTANRRFQVMARGASLVGSARRSDVRVVAQELSLWRPAMHLHQWAVSVVQAQGGSTDGRAIVAALSTGERGLMSDSLLSAVRASGLAHLLAVSGMHMAAVVALVFFLVIRLWCLSPYRQVLEPAAVAAGVALLAAFSFTLLTGARPSTCRALIVATLVLVGVMVDRRMTLLSALAWAAIALLLWRPVYLFDPGFQMSFAATVALAIAFSRESDALEFTVPSRGRRLLRALWSILRASSWASFATLPIALHHFGEVSGIAVLSNIVAVPLVTIVLLPSALLGISLSALSPALGSVVLVPCVAGAEWLARLCYRLEGLFPMQLRAPLGVWELFLWGGTVVLLLWNRLPPARRWPLRRRTQWLALALCMALGTWLRGQGGQAPEHLRITFVEIGQGDAAIIELPGGEVWLVDGGGLPFVAPTAHGDRQWLAETPARRALLPYLRHRKIRGIDLAIVSHPHPDHYVGLQAVAREMPIRELWSVHEVSERPGPYEKWLAELKASGTRIRAPRVGVARMVGGTSLEVMWPLYSAQLPPSDSRAAQGDPVLTVNDNSLVVRLSSAGRNVLFAGDIEEEAEELLLEQYGTLLRADVLKVPHHGSRTSSTEAFARATKPRVAVISCGRANRFEFPDSEVVRRWEKHAGQLLRTDLVGSITVEIEDSGRMHVSAVDGF
ncbi:MAG: DNA internalization-related competence protein ComEC/Rec2 [Myxococcales bacterium]|nr:DNA internalization-related competence protein ComEC/Rec2 [Myxococcales bacterium]